MTIQKTRRKRDIENTYPVTQFVKKLRRLADCIEHERGTSSEEVEFQLKWSLEK
jgi:hypothetical protein